MRQRHFEVRQGRAGQDRAGQGKAKRGKEKAEQDMAWKGKACKPARHWRQNILASSSYTLGWQLMSSAGKQCYRKKVQTAATHLSMALKKDQHLCFAPQHFLQVVTGQPRPGLTLLERIRYCRSAASKLGLCCSAQEKAPQSSSCIPAQPQTTIGSAYAQRVVTVSWSGRMLPGKE